MKTGPSAALVHASLNYEVERISARLDSCLRCTKGPGHGRFDYVCTSPDGVCDKLICVDCLRTDQTHFNAHARYFVRVRDFLETVTRVSDKSTRQKQLRDLLAFERRLKSAVEEYDENWSKTCRELRSFYDRVYESFAQVLKKKCQAAAEKVIEECRQSLAPERKGLQRVFDTSADLSKFANKGHLLDLYLMLEKSASVNDLRKKFTKLNHLTHNFDKILEDWSAKTKGFSGADEAGLAAQLNAPYLQAHIAKQEPLFASLLDQLAPEVPDLCVSSGAKKFLASFSVANTTQMIGNIDQSISHIRTNRQMQDDPHSFILDVTAPAEPKSKRLMEIDRRIEEVFKELPDK